jgi:hypothetical protein
VHHAPPVVAAAHEPLLVAAAIDFPELVQHAWLVCRPASSGEAAEWRAVEFLRASPGPYVASIPEDAVRPPGLEYAIELELVDGTRESVFASRAEPHRVAVEDDLMDVRERAALERLDGRRSVVSASFDYANFGKSAVATQSGVVDASDWYYRTEGAYAYRPLRVVDEFSIHVGIVRGRSPGNAGTVGLNYGSAFVKFRASDLVRLEAELLTSVTEVGFSAGAGGSVDIGDPYGSKLVLGFESIAVFGNRLFSKVDVRAAPRLRLAPIVEATNMPHTRDRWGVRLLGEAAYDFGGFGVALRGGYQARDSASGGLGAGLSLFASF